MLAHSLLLLAALAVKQDQTPLRSGCEAADETIATLPAGTPVEVRFRVADGSDCFKIAATVNGKPVVGYVPASALSNVDQFEQQRNAAVSLDSSRALNPVEVESKKVAARSSDPALKQASQLIEANQPTRALEILEPMLKRDPKNPDLLLLAGLAAYRADQARTALDYWKQSLDLAPNDALERIYDKVHRESQADRCTSRFAMKGKRSRPTPRVPLSLRSIRSSAASRACSDAGPTNASSPSCKAAKRICVVLARPNGAAANTTDASTFPGWTEPT